jgi:hypothetical protein
MAAYTELLKSRRLKTIPDKCFQGRKVRKDWRAGAVLSIFWLSIAPLSAFAGAEAFNQPGDLLIADQFNNRVIEITPDGEIVWQFGLGPNDVSPKSIVGTNDAQRVGPSTLMAGTGVPPASPPFEPKCANGCVDNRVLLVDQDGHIVWQYGQFGVTGSGPNQLNVPVQSTWTPRMTVLITDQSNERIIEVNLNKQIIWQYGQTGMTGSGSDQLNNPNSAELLENGHVLIADENNNRAIEVDHDKNVVQTFTVGGTASGVAFASRLPNGNTLITDSNNSRIVEVDPGDNPVWTYITNRQPGSKPAPLPTRAIRTRTGNTVISDQFNDRVIIVNKAQQIIAEYGNLNSPGYGKANTSQGLNAPYDAKVIGDYTGLTPPFEFGFTSDSSHK